MTFSFELERSSLNILKFYHPVFVTAAHWSSMTFDDQKTMFRQLLDLTPPKHRNTTRAVIANMIHKEYPKRSPEWFLPDVIDQYSFSMDFTAYRFCRICQAVKNANERAKFLGLQVEHFLPDTLIQEVADTTWEISHRNYTTNLQQMSRQLSFAGELFGQAGSCHVHLVFPIPPFLGGFNRNPDSASLRKLIGVIATHLNDYGFLRSFANSPNVMYHPYLAVWNQENVENLKDRLYKYDKLNQLETMTDGHNWGTYKEAIVAFRAGKNPYHNSNLIGFEFRSSFQEKANHGAKRIDILKRIALLLSHMNSFSYAKDLRVELSVWPMAVFFPNRRFYTLTDLSQFQDKDRNMESDTMATRDDSKKAKDAPVPIDLYKLVGDSNTECEFLPADYSAEYLSTQGLKTVSSYYDGMSGTKCGTVLLNPKLYAFTNYVFKFRLNERFDGLPKACQSYQKLPALTCFKEIWKGWRLSQSPLWSKLVGTGLQSDHFWEYVNELPQGPSFFEAELDKKFQKTLVRPSRWFERF